jgi:hypothetical protein
MTKIRRLGFDHRPVEDLPPREASVDDLITLAQARELYRTWRVRRELEEELRSRVYQAPRTNPTPAEDLPPPGHKPDDDPVT